MPDARKVALVIGNGAYAHASKLEAPRRDAIEVATLLERMGFSVVAGFDCDYVKFRDLAEDFHDRLDSQAVALFYFSGHGAQAMDGGNHMLPVDARLVDPRDLGRVTMPLNDMLERMRQKARVSLILLDACRDDPFDDLHRPTGTKSVFAGRPGLAAVPRASLGQALIGFAAEEGHTALDAGAGKPSPFTAALVRHLATPGKDIRDILGEVRREVKAATDGRQTPWTKEALDEEVVLVPDGTQLAPEVLPITRPPPDRSNLSPSSPLTAPPSRSVLRFGPVAVALLALAAGGVALLQPRALCGLPGTTLWTSCQTTAADLVPLIGALDSADRKVRLDAQTRLAAAFGVPGISAEQQLQLGQELLFAASLDNMLELSRDGRYGLVFVLAEIPKATWRTRAWAASLKAATGLYDELSSAVDNGELDIPVVRQSHLDRFGENIGANMSSGDFPPDSIRPGLIAPATDLAAPTR